jgi:hypothetical protein
MSRNGTGTYNLPAGNPVVTGTVIASTWANSTLTDIASALTGSVAADGQTPMVGDLDMNNNKITNLEPGTVAGNAIEYDQFVAASSTNVNIVGGTINGTTIGVTTPASGRFTTLQATGATTLGSTLAVTGYATFSSNGEFNGTGALKIPVGTTGQQPTPATGMLRFNSSSTKFEGYNGTAWGSIGEPAGSNTQIQYNNSGVFGASSAFTFNGTTLTVPKIAFASSNIPSLTNYQGGALTSGTSVASTSGTSIDFTSIPSWVKRITVCFNGVSTNGSSNVQIQIGTSSGIETIGYNSGAGYSTTPGTFASSTTGLILDTSANAASLRYGSMIISLLGSDTWVDQCCTYSTTTITNTSGGGAKTLSATLDRVRITTVNGTDTFDAGTINILYE